MKKAMKPLTLSEYASLGIKKNGKCHHCQGQLAADNLRHEDHSGGWKVKGIEGLQWLWFHCDECGYDTSLQTFGISKPLPTT